jgi:hypothetical protein
VLDTDLMMVRDDDNDVVLSMLASVVALCCWICALCFVCYDRLEVVAAV